jgi:hypothetical protein
MYELKPVLLKRRKFTKFDCSNRYLRNLFSMTIRYQKYSKILSSSTHVQMRLNYFHNLIIYFNFAQSTVLKEVKTESGIRL